jgi:predicted transcriptional regulator
MIKDIDIELLTALFEAKEPTSTAELARIVGCPRTTASDYMLSLEKEGIVVDVGGKSNMRKWVMTEEYRQKVERELGFSEEVVSDALETLVKEGKVEKSITGGGSSLKGCGVMIETERKLSDAVKYYLVHSTIFPEKLTTKLLEDSIAEIDDIVAKSKDIDISSKINKFYDLVNDIYYNRSGADYSRGLLRDGYIKCGLPVPTYVPSKLDVNKYDDIQEC